MCVYICVWCKAHTSYQSQQREIVNVLVIINVIEWEDKELSNPLSVQYNKKKLEKNDDGGGLEIEN